MIMVHVIALYNTWHFFYFSKKPSVHIRLIYIDTMGESFQDYSRNQDFEADFP